MSKMAKKKSNTISAAELEFIRVLVKHYDLSMEKDHRGEYEVRGYLSGGVQFYWDGAYQSLQDFLDELKEYFEEIGAAKALENFKERLGGFLNQD